VGVSQRVLSQVHLCLPSTSRRLPSCKADRHSEFPGTGSSSLCAWCFDKGKDQNVLAIFVAENKAPTRDAVFSKKAARNIAVADGNRKRAAITTITTRTHSIDCCRSKGMCTPKLGSPPPDLSPRKYRRTFGGHNDYQFWKPPDRGLEEQPTFFLNSALVTNSRTPPNYLYWLLEVNSGLTRLTFSFFFRLKGYHVAPFRISSLTGFLHLPWFSGIILCPFRDSWAPHVGQCFD